MIRLRHAIERGRRHPILGPLVLVLLILVLAMVSLHGAHDSHDAAVDVGAFCLAILVLIGPIALDLARRSTRPAIVDVRGDRGPPRVATARTPIVARASSAAPMPLRR